MWKKALVAGAIVLVVIFGWWLNQPVNLPMEEEAESQEQNAPWEDAVVQTVQEVGPATVKIETVREFVVDRFFFQFLEEQTGVGSGVIYRPDGYIITNNHVIADASDILVRLPDGRSFDAEVVGRDSYTDLAVLKVDATDLPAVAMGDSNELRVGQGVIAIGNPLGQDNTVTTGVVSAVNRNLLINPEENQFLEGLIQTDAAINPGNSGGPLLSRGGQVVGINTAIIQNAQGIGFAIPANQAQRVADQIIEEGRPLRLGVVGGSLTPALAETIRRQTDTPLAVDVGAFITRIIPDTPAAGAGMQPGDVIVSVNGQDIAGMRELNDLVQEAGFGQKINLSYYRGEEQREVEVTL